MKQSTNLEAFDDWMSWKDNAYDLKYSHHTKISQRHMSYPKKLNEQISTVCLGLGLRPTVDFQITMYEVRFRTKTFLAMFKMNYGDE